MKNIEKYIKLDSSKIIINSGDLKIDNVQREIDKESEQLNDKWNKRLSNFFISPYLTLFSICMVVYIVLHYFFSIKNLKPTFSIFICVVCFVLVEIIHLVVIEKIDKKYTYTHTEAEYNILSEIIDVWKDIRKSLEDNHAEFLIEKAKKKFYLQVSYIDNKNCLVKRSFELMDSIKFYDNKTDSADEKIQISFYNSENTHWDSYVKEQYVEVFFPKSFYNLFINNSMEKNIF